MLAPPILSCGPLSCAPWHPIVTLNGGVWLPGVGRLQLRPSLVWSRLALEFHLHDAHITLVLALASCIAHAHLCCHGPLSRMPPTAPPGPRDCPSPWPAASITVLSLHPRHSSSSWACSLPSPTPCSHAARLLISPNVAPHNYSPGH
jgi:hypothetical protein